MIENEIRYYDIGSLVYCVEGPAFEDPFYLKPFRVENGKMDAIIKITIVDFKPFSKLIKGNGGWRFLEDGSKEYLDHDTDKVIYHIKDNSSEKTVMVSYNSDFFPKYEVYCSQIILTSMDMPHKLMLKKQLFLHSSLITVDGKAILFTAKSQTGKSTQAALWEKFRGAEIINGDRSLLKKQDDVWYACGSPYCGSSKICKKGEFPIWAIVILSQAKENTAARATPHAIFSALMNGFTYDVSNKSEVETVTEIASDLISSVPFYTLACTPDERAIEALESVLSASENH